MQGGGCVGEFEQEKLLTQFYSRILNLRIVRPNNGSVIAQQAQQFCGYNYFSVISEHPGSTDLYDTSHYINSREIKAKI